jgi:hypothetical protein
MIDTLHLLPRARSAGLISLVLALAACGGGGTSDSGTPTLPAALSLSGTAATGVAIAGGAVEAKCATGTGTATTADSGTYSLSITGGALPCVLRVTAGSVVLHSVATGSGGSAQANLTPVTELVVARLAGSGASAYFSSFGGSVSAAEVQAAVDAVVATLKDGGLDLTAAGNPLSGTLVAASGSTAGDAYDQALDTLKTRLAANGSTLAALADTVAVTSPAAPAGTSSGIAAVPAAQQLQPAAATCAGLHSGTYRFVEAAPSPDNHFLTGKVSLDARMLTIVDPTDPKGAGPLTPVTGAPCRFRLNDGSDLVFSQAGIAVIAYLEGSTHRLVLLFPEQTLALADLAGEWSKLGLNGNGGAGTATVDAATIAVDASGNVTGGVYCGDVTTCVAVPTTLVISSHPDGGFSYRDTAAGWTDRLFAYRAGGGEMMMVGVALDGSINLWTRKRSSTLPTLPASPRNTFGIYVNNQLAVTALAGGGYFGDSSSTVVSVDTAGNSFTRSAVINTTGVTRLETLDINAPRDGYNTRRAETVTASDGSSSVVSEFVVLGLRGTGLSAVVVPAINQFVLAIEKP